MKHSKPFNLLLFVLVISSVSCSGQNNSKEKRDTTVSTIITQPPISEYQAPTVSTEKVNIDSNYLRVKVLSKGYELTFRNKTKTVKDSTELEQFVAKKKEMINDDKIIVVSSKTTKTQLYYPLIAVLRHNGFMKFNMITQ